MIRRSVLCGALLVVALLPMVASADPIAPGEGRRLFLTDDTPTVVDPAATAHAGSVSPIIYLERCKGGCIVHGAGNDDAKSYTSSIATPGDNAIGEYRDSLGNVGAAADAEWNALVACVKEVYSPYAAQVTDVKPVNATGYHMDIVAGVPQDVGLGNDVLGVSSGGVGCNPKDNGISYTFANAHGGNAQARLIEMCWTVAQETAHTYSLDHAFVFADGTSACKDAMTYRRDCGGVHYFRNLQATCGENTARPCRCGATQNAHLTLLNTFGMGVTTTPPPTVSVMSPTAGTKITNGSAVVGKAFSNRGVDTVELWLNGYKWTQVLGTKFGPNGQVEGTYSIPLPQDVPDGVIDVVLKAKDDLGATSASTAVTVTKGAPCADASTCANGQICEAGKCFWDAPVGEIGDKCTFAQYCVSGICQGTADDTICTTSCVPGVADACENPDLFECLEQSPGHGVCWPKDDGGGGCGCASSGSDAAPFVFGFFGVALLLRRRRR